LQSGEGNCSGPNIESIILDVDLDPKLMQKFSCLDTTDKDILISEFQHARLPLNLAGYELSSWA
jgi:hypothetical protein